MKEAILDSAIVDIVQRAESDIRLELARDRRLPKEEGDSTPPSVVSHIYIYIYIFTYIYIHI